MAFPENLEELKAAGYVFQNHATCGGPNCHATIEWWQTPRNKRIPLDVDEKGNIQAHWGKCPDRETFRK